QLAVTAEEMSGQADTLQQLMAFFRIDTAGSSAASSTAGAAAAPTARPAVKMVSAAKTVKTGAPWRGNGATHPHDAEFTPF
ncbi:MAG TPA: hypothetical protein VJ572_12455, partial [Azonexus sp.]|nr:hypothetical protein [Azonexus sp.]